MKTLLILLAVLSCTGCATTGILSPPEAEQLIQRYQDKCLDYGYLMYVGSDDDYHYLTVADQVFGDSHYLVHRSDLLFKTTFQRTDDRTKWKLAYEWLPRRNKKIEQEGRVESRKLDPTP